MGKIIGIDFGTSNSRVSVLEGRTPVIIQNLEGGRSTPSVIHFADNGEKISGAPAKNQMVAKPESTVYSIKPFLGRRYSQAGDETKLFPYRIDKQGDDIRVDIKGEKYSAQTITAFTLGKLKQAAESYLGEAVTEAVMTVPACFSFAQYQEIKEAGKIAGLDVKRIISESVAASLAYGFNKDSKKDKVVAVCNIGGCFFDITIMEIGDGVFEVKSTNGDARLGGDEFDRVIARWLADEFKKDTGIDLGQDLMAYQRLREAAEKAKIELSAMQTAEINLPYIASGQDGPKHLQKPLTREMFAQMIKKHLESIGSLCAEALKEAGVTAEQIDEVILVGASSRIPAVKQAVKDVFNKEPVKGVNTDEAVAEGAAIQGGILSGDIKDVLLMDATTFSYGIETSGGFMKKMLKRNTTTPSRNSHIFTTAADNQTLVTIQVLEGEKEKAAQNLVLGRFDLSGISPAPRGTAQIEVTFDIDANKTIHVTAKDLRAGKEQRICIENPSGLSYQEIDQKAGIAMVGGTDESGEAEKKYRESKMALLESGYDKAVPLLKEAADKGHAGAQYELADCYYNGKGVTQDYAKAAEWYKKAADQGNADARNTLGVCYYQGKGVKQDYSKAVECFQIAANQGYSSSVLNLGSCYHYGNGVQKDYTKALELYQKAADSGNETAKKALNDLKDKIANPVCAKCGAKIDQGSKFCDKCGAPV